MASPSQITVFDRKTVRRRRDRASSGWPVHNALFLEAARHLIDRLADVKRDFSAILDLGAHDGVLARDLSRENRFVVASDISDRMLAGASHAVAADEELLPFAPRSFDLVISNLSLHWANDLPGTLAQIKNILKTEGLFLAALLGGNTLQEFRTCLLEAEAAITGGASPRLSPTIELQTAAGLLQRAGFALPVADQETIMLTYTDAFALMRDLRGMGEGNAHQERLRHPTRRAVFDEAARLYAARFGLEGGRVPARFDVVFLHGWKG